MNRTVQDDGRASERLIRLIDLGKRARLFLQDPEFDKALEAYALTQDPFLYEYLIRRCLATGFFQGRLLSRNFELPYSQDELKGEITIGRILDTDFIYRVGIDDLTRHGFLAGSPGVGKTVTLNALLISVVKAGIKVVLIDPKGGDFNGFIPEDVLYIRWHELRFNILCPPANVELNRWIPRLAEALSEPLGLLIASLGTLDGFLERTFGRWLGKLFPCFREFGQEVKSEARTFGKAGMYRETVENRIDTVNHTLSEVLWCRRGFMDELMSRSFILDISDLIGVAQNVLVECLMAYIYMWHAANVPRERQQKLVRAVCIDEAQHNVLAAGKGRTARISAAGMDQAIALGREMGLAFIASAQSPSKILPEIINDAHLRICFGLGSGEEIFHMSRALGLTREQAEHIQHLRVGQAIVRKSTGFTFPALIQCFQADLKQPTEEDWKRNEEQLRALQALAEPCTSEDTTGAQFVGINLNPNAQRLLTAIGENPTCTMMELYGKAGLAGQTGNKAKEQLVRANLIEEEDLPGAGSGRTKSAWLKPDGVQAYRNLSQKDHKKLFKTQQAGFVHDWWVNRVAGFFYRKQDKKFEIAKQLGNQQADLVITDKEKTAYEVTLSMNNVQAKLDMLTHVDKLVYLYVNENSKKQLENKLEIPESLASRINFKPLKEFL